MTQSIQKFVKRARDAYLETDKLCVSPSTKLSREVKDYLNGAKDGKCGINGDRQSAWDDDISVYVHRRYTARRMTAACFSESAAEERSPGKIDRQRTGSKASLVQVGDASWARQFGSPLLYPLPVEVDRAPVDEEQQTDLPWLPRGLRKRHNDRRW